MALGVLAVVALAPMVAVAQGPAEPASATVEVTVWRRVANPSLLYLSTRPEGGRWKTENTALDMSALSSSRRFHQSNAVLVDVPLPDVPQPDPPPAVTCVYTEEIERVASATFQVRTTESTGTAFYIGNGEWITNHHVVESASTVWLLHGETELRAQVTGSLPAYDLAMLRVQPPASVTPLAFAPTRLALASAVTVVGFPAYVQGTPSAVRGIVSKYAPLSQFQDMASDGWALQTDAPANPGNSGGPIVDDCGVVVAVTFSRYEYTAGGRPIQGIGFGIAGETAVAQLASLRSAGHGSGDTPEEQSYLTISAFCTFWASEDLDSDECHDRSHMLDGSQEYWTVWTSGVEDFDNVIFRFNEGAEVFEDGVWDELLALGSGCHELEVAEDGISTHWSLPYEFCFASATDLPSNAALTAPTGLWVAKIDIPAAPDDIRVTWNAVQGATWYELYHAAGDEDWQFKATVTNTVYVDTAPSWLYPDHYTLRACNAEGCSEFSSIATQD